MVTEEESIQPSLLRQIKPEAPQSLKADVKNREEEQEDGSKGVVLDDTTWLQQFYWATWKNFLILRRRSPSCLFLLLFSSVLSSIFAWCCLLLVFGPTDISVSCYGACDFFLWHVNTERNLCILSLGAAVNAGVAFFLVHEEVASHLLAVLRSLGMRESVYWMSWYFCLGIIALVNSILGGVALKILNAVTTKILGEDALGLPVYFGGILGSFFFLQLAVIPTSLFLVAICKGPANIFAKNLIAISIILLLPWAPLAVGQRIGWTPLSTFQGPKTGCVSPLVRDGDVGTPRDETDLFAGEYFLENARPHPAMYLLPYSNFLEIWGYFITHAELSGNMFTHIEASLPMEALAAKSYSPNPGEGGLFTLAPQLSTFRFIGRCSASLLDFNVSVPICDGCKELVVRMQGLPSVHGLYGRLFCLSLLYLLLTWYWAQIFPGAKLLFFLRKKYWLRRKILAHDRCKNDGVAVCRVQKMYRGFVALDNLSFTMARGNITALLGRNGAGKTSLSSIIACELELTSGNGQTDRGTTSDVVVFGHSVAADPYLVRQMVGFCRQDDYFWSHLTAKEHLQLFGAIRGVSLENLDDVVHQWSHSLRLDSDFVQSQYPSQYSGGMRRRLSLALATIGDRPLVILDEPTTRMDPARAAWRHIDEIKKDRVVLLTSHAMDEADVLADKVVILGNGKLLDSGSPLELKTRHGVDLHFSLLVQRNDVDATIECIRRFFCASHQWVTIELSRAGNIDVKIGKVTSLKQNGNRCNDDTNEGVAYDLLSKFVSWLDAAESKVVEYRFASSSLEDVFLKVTTEGQDENQSGEECCEAQQWQLTDDTECGNAANIDTDALISSFQPLLDVKKQTLFLFRFWVTRSWAPGVWSARSFAMLLLLGVIHAVLASDIWWLRFSALVMCMPLPAILWPIHSDRIGGHFHLMQSQGLIPDSYTRSIALFISNVNILNAVFAHTTIFIVASSVTGFWIDQSVSILHGAQDGSWVDVETHFSPGGYGLFLVNALAFSFASTGTALVASLLPASKATVLLVTIFTFSGALVVGLLPWGAGYLSSVHDANCPDGFFDLNDHDTDFPICFGKNMYGYGGVTPFLSIFPVVGVYQGIVVACSARIEFDSAVGNLAPAGYVETVLIPSIDGSCEGNSCEMPEAIHHFWMSTVWMMIGGVVWLFLGITLAPRFVFQSKHGCRIGLPADNRSRRKLELNEQDNTEDVADLPIIQDETDVVATMVQPFVEEEEIPRENATKVILNTEAIERQSVSPILIHKLRKVYPESNGNPPKVALHSLSMHVPRGHVLGLLGENGAGKTTAMRVMSGACDKSGGLALVAGYDSSLERVRVSERHGSCAQFDVYWDNWSVKEHLQFFAAFKGLDKDSIDDAVRRAAQAVGLGEEAVFNRQAKKLSGGMKRRLTIAMALLGAPVVLSFDEPTTGLDPSSRNSIWSLFSSFAAPERTMIITTHMMLEADTLCDHIAILAEGRLRVIGNQSNLKRTLGDGFILQATLIGGAQEDEDRAMEFARSRLHPDATLRARRAKTLFVDIPRDLKLDSVFQALCSVERTEIGGINHFALSECPLETVFLLFGERD